MQSQYTYPTKDSDSEYIKNSYGLFLKDRQPNRKMAEEDTQMLSEHMERYPTSSVIREMQIQIRMSYYYSLMGKANMRKMEKENRCCGWGAARTLVPCWWEGRWVQPAWRTVWQNMLQHYEPVTHSQAMYPTEMHLSVHRKTCTKCAVVLFIITKK